jgi:hypothetical protein
MSLYDSVDKNLVSSKAGQWAQTLPGTVGGTTDQVSSRNAQDDALAQSRVALIRMNDEYAQTVMFQKNTDLLAQMNESWNANAYLNSAIVGEQDRVHRADVDARRDLYRLRQQAMYADYMSHYYDAATRVVLLSIYVTLLLLMPVALWKMGRISSGQMLLLDGILLLLYLVVLVAICARTAGRCNGAWQQFYWGAGSAVSGQQAQQGSCG